LRDLNLNDQKILVYPFATNDSINIAQREGPMRGSAAGIPLGEFP